MDSILNSTKKILGLAADYTAFDLDVITHINAAFSTLYQLGFDHFVNVSVEDDSMLWSDLGFSPNSYELNMIRTYVFLKVKILFDPPTTSFHTESMQNQIKEMEYRLNTFREETEWTAPVR